MNASYTEPVVYVITMNLNRQWVVEEASIIVTHFPHIKRSEIFVFARQFNREVAIETGIGFPQHLWIAWKLVI